MQWCSMHFPLMSLSQPWDQRTPDGTRMFPSLGHGGIHWLQPHASAPGSDLSSHLSPQELLLVIGARRPRPSPEQGKGAETCWIRVTHGPAPFPHQSEGWIPQCTAASRVPSSLRVSTPRAGRRRQVLACPAQNQPELFQQVRARWGWGAAPCMEEKENGSMLWPPDPVGRRHGAQGSMGTDGA